MNSSRGAVELAAVFLSLGSNLGDRKANIREALSRLSANSDIQLKDISSLYETAPIGYADQPDFINAVACVRTDLSPIDLFYAIVEIESGMGRVRNFHWEPRVIDIDILFYDHVEMDAPELTIPHPRMMERAFVIAPLAEIVPNMILPNGRKPEEVLMKLADQQVRKLAEEE